MGDKTLAARSEFWEKRLKTGNTDGIVGGLDELQGLLEVTIVSLEAWVSG